MDARGSEGGSVDLGSPGTLLDGRFRVGHGADRRGSTITGVALDERTRQRVRVRVGPTRPDPRVARLRHPLLPPVVACGHAAARGWIATAWFDGAPLELPTAPLRSRTAVLAWAAALSDVLEALELVHGAIGRAHGAIGLRSFWVAGDGRLRLVDAVAPDPRLSPEDLVWAPPERSLAPTPDPRSDLYAVAAVFYGLATAVPPFGADPVEANAGHAAARLPDHPALPPEVLAVLRTAMEKRPHHRFPTAERMRAALARALAESEPTVPLDLDPEPLEPTDPADDGTMSPPAGRSFLPSPRPRPGARIALLCALGVALSVAAWAALASLLSTLLGA